MEMYSDEAAFSNFEILDLSKAPDVLKLRNLVLAEPHHSASPAGYALLDTLLTDDRCRSVVVEKRYLDRDHLRSFQRFYARGFAEYDRYASRLHFFGTTVTNADLSDLERVEFSSSYLGFCVLRPLRVRKIGRTVIRPISADQQVDYPLSLSEYEVNLAGSRLKVHGAQRPQITESSILQAQINKPPRLQIGRRLR